MDTLVKISPAKAGRHSESNVPHDPRQLVLELTESVTGYPSVLHHPPEMKSRGQISPKLRLHRPSPPQLRLLLRAVLGSPLLPWPQAAA